MNIQTNVMRALGLLGVAALCSSAATAQSVATPQGIAGYLNPSTGAFTAAPHAAKAMPPDYEPYASTTVGGTFKFVMAITLKSSIPTTSKILCNAIASERDSDFSSEVAYYETKSVVATRTGTTAACTVAIPYSWLLPSVAGTTVSLSYSVNLVPTTETDLLQRTHNATLNSITLPANGATTTKSVKVTL